MATPNSAADQEWEALAELSEEDREARMLQRYAEISVLGEEERRSQMLAMAHAEYAVPDEKIRAFTVSRLRTWLRLEPEVAKQIAGSYDAVMLEIPGAQAMRRVALDQTLAREFSLEDQERLVDLAPRVFGGIVAKPPAPEPQPAPEPEPPAKRRWWPFGKR